MKQAGNILLVANWESNVGYAWWLMENFWMTISNHLSDKGIKSFLIYPKITKIPETIASTNIEIIEHNFNNRSFSALKNLRYIIKSNNIQHIYLTDQPAYSWTYLLLRTWGVQTIIVHDHTPGDRTTPSGLKRIVKSFVQKIPYYTADHFIAVTHYVLDRLINVSCIPASKCSCATNGITPIDLESADKSYASKLFGIPNNRTIVVTTGRATFYKGIDFFIECANEIINNQGRTDFHFIYCGDGPDLDSFKKMVSDYKLNDHFLVAGRRNDVRKILPTCDIGFHSALGEVGYSLSILEYMSAGLVTIVPDNPSTSATIEHEINGYKYTPNSTQAASNMILAAAKRLYLSDITMNAIKDVNNKYNINSTNRTICKIFDQITP